MACVNVMCWFSKVQPSATFCRPDADAEKERGHRPFPFLILTATVTTKDHNYWRRLLAEASVQFHDKEHTFSMNVMWCYLFPLRRLFAQETRR